MLRRLAPNAVIKPLACAMVLALGLAACSTTGSGFGADESNLTPAQRELRQEAERFNQTVLEGALTGALIGGIAGALLSEDDPLAGAAIGAGAGAAVGAGAGFFVASQNEEYANEEQRLEAQVAAAQEDVARYERIVLSTERVVNEYRQRIARLDSQYADGQVTAAEYRNQVAGVQTDLDAIQALIDENGNIVEAYEAEIASLRQQGRSSTELAAARTEMIQEREALQSQYNELLSAVDGAAVELG